MSNLGGSDLETTCSTQPTALLSHLPTYHRCRRRRCHRRRPCHRRRRRQQPELSRSYFVLGDLRQHPSYQPAGKQRAARKSKMAPVKIHATCQFISEFKPETVLAIMPTAQKVVYYIYPFQHHDPPNPASGRWAAHGLVCEVLPPPPRGESARLIAELQTKEYDVPTLIIIAKTIFDR